MLDHQSGAFVVQITPGSPRNAGRSVCLGATRFICPSNAIEARKAARGSSLVTRFFRNMFLAYGDKTSLHNLRLRAIVIR